MDIDPNILNEIEDSASENEEIVPPVIEWSEDSEGSAVDEIIEEIDSEQKKKNVKGVKGSTGKSKTPAKPRASARKDAAQKSGAPKRSQKTFVCESPPGEGLIIQCNILFGTTLSENISNSVLSSNSNIELIKDGSAARLCFFDWVRVSEILAAVEAIRSVCKREKVKIKGCIYLMYRESPNTELTSGCIKVNSRHPVFTNSDIKITSVAEKKEDQPKKFTEEEKMQLFKEYYENNHKLPDKKEVYKEFKIGQFYESAMKNKNMVSQIDEIINENE